MDRKTNISKSIVLSQSTTHFTDGISLTDNSGELNVIFEDLCEKIRQLSSLIRSQIITNSNTHNISNDLVLKEVRLLDNLNKLIKSPSPTDLPKCNTQAVLDLLESTVEEKSSFAETIDILQRELEEDRAKLKCYKDNLSLKKNQKEEELVNPKLLHSINEEFRECKNDLKTVMEKLYPDNTSVKDLLADLIGRTSNEGDEKWYDLSSTPDLYHIVSILVQAGVVKFHPNNAHLVKLII